MNTTRKLSLTVPAVLLLLILTACAGQTAAPAAEQAAQPDMATAAQDTAPSASEDTSPADTGPDEPAAPEASSASIVDAFTAPVTATGDLLIITGRVMNVNGDPLPGAAVEIWQTDQSGVYDHPGDPGTNSRDMNFQFYGTSVAAADGTYAFRTIMPGHYEPRPRHIHVKVKLDGNEVLTTQLYFAEDGNTGGFGGPIDNLLLTGEQVAMDDGASVRVATFDIVVDTGIGSGSLPLTDSQGEGPYYPVIDVSAFDNDLASVQ